MADHTATEHFWLCSEQTAQSGFFSHVLSYKAPVPHAVLQSSGGERARGG